MKEIYDTVKNILIHETLAYLATSYKNYTDNSTVAYWADESFNIFYGSYSDTLKCKNIHNNPYVGLVISTLQIHGVARKIEHNSEEYNLKIQGYNEKFPQYAHVFNNENNELYIIKPLVIWNYNSTKGEMYRDKIIFDESYFGQLGAYEPPLFYNQRKN